MKDNVAKIHSLLSTLSIEILAGFVASLYSLIIFAKISDEVIEKDLYRYDLLISNFTYSLRTPFLTNLFTFITNLGGISIVIMSILLTLTFFYFRHFKETLLFLLTFSLGVIFNFLLKNFFHIARPGLSPLVFENSFSFPSGHAMNSTVFYGLLAYMTYHLTQNKKTSVISGAVFSCLILLIGFSRIYLGVHYPSDVLAGFIAGFWWLVTAILIEKTISRFGRLR